MAKRFILCCAALYRTFRIPLPLVAFVHAQVLPAYRVDLPYVQGCVRANRKRSSTRCLRGSHSETTTLPFTCSLVPWISMVSRCAGSTSSSTTSIWLCFLSASSSLSEIGLLGESCFCRADPRSKLGYTISMVGFALITVYMIFCAGEFFRLETH